MAIGNIIKTQIIVDGITLPATIYREMRMDVRAGMGKKNITLRVPWMTSTSQISQHLNWLNDWVKQVFDRNPAMKTRFIGKSYQTGDVLVVGNRRYVLEVTEEDRQTHTAQMAGDTIMLTLSAKASHHHRQKSIKSLLSRIVAHDFYPEIFRKVMEINRLYFDQPIKNVTLKYNHSNWGSCSAKGNVNLSTRLLFAPDEVQTYVIIHELAHLIELNHSDRFWALVRAAMPHYKKQEKWLKDHGAQCDF